MPKTPVMTAKQLVKFLVSIGFAFVRQRGSHTIFRHADGRRTIVPMHPGDIPIGTFHGILKDIELKPEDIE